MEKHIDFTITIADNGSIDICSYDHESGYGTKVFSAPDMGSLDKAAFDKAVGNEIYSWLSLMNDEMEEG